MTGGRSDMPTALRLLVALRSCVRLLAAGSAPSWACAWAAAHHKVDRLTLASLLLTSSPPAGIAVVPRETSADHQVHVLGVQLGGF